MGKKLVIVESPTKVKTIKKFLGKNYEVMASQGHVRDFPKSTLGIDFENDYEPKYITIRGKGDLLSSLRKEAKKADHVYLATDPDREGEAISWHLTKAIPLDDDKYDRITFNEITKNAVKSSLKTPRKIDMDLVDSQQARRMLDRMVGYQISPLLWAKVKSGLSAGRVQSMALHIIREREDEIEAFIPQEYYTLDAVLKDESGSEIKLSYYGEDGKKTDLSDNETTQKIISDCRAGEFVVTTLKTGERTKKHPLPFTTSTMQQDAAKKLGYSISKTMRIAQGLYEGKDIPGRGTVGLITYLRTDSVRISDEAKAAATEFITETYGSQYLGNAEDARGKKSDKKNVQDAHEAIRPSDITLVPAQLKGALTRDELRLYELIWKRFASSMMAPAKYDTASLRVTNTGHIFSASASSLVFDGYLKVYQEADADDSEKPGQFNVSALREGQVLKEVSYDDQKHFTKPLPHFNEGSLVKAMEEMGIGRPSTYSPTISTLIKRHYIAIEDKNIHITELGEVVDDIMAESFGEIVNESFTANMETKLDEVEEGSLQWKTIVREFYPTLERNVEIAEKELEKVKIEDETTEVICEKCGRNMVVKYGPHGKFLACPGFPECRNTKPYLEKIGVPCPKCEKDIVLRKTRKGRKFYGCEDYPECDFTSWSKPVKEACPKCGSYMTWKGKKIACSSEECGYFTTDVESDD